MCGSSFLKVGRRQVTEMSFVGSGSGNTPAAYRYKYRKPPRHGCVRVTALHLIIRIGMHMHTVIAIKVPVAGIAQPFALIPMIAAEAVNALSVGGAVTRKAAQEAPAVITNLALVVPVSVLLLHPSHRRPARLCPRCRCLTGRHGRHGPGSVVLQSKGEVLLREREHRDTATRHDESVLPPARD